MKTYLYVENDGNEINIVGKKGSYIYFNGFDFNEGFVEVEASPGMHIEEFAEIIVGCFEDGSNFERVCRENFIKSFCEYVIKGIKLKFNGVIIVVSKENAEVNGIVKAYFKN